MSRIKSEIIKYLNELDVYQLRLVLSFLKNLLD